MTNSLDRLRVALTDRYTVERELGSGATATVYLAEDLKHERRVALKVLSPELAAALGQDRFLQEIKIAANLHHPHILPLYDSGEAGGFLYYVMPYAEGESLRDRLRREKQLAIDDALQVAREVADALSYAHSHGVIHRDIKPENILLVSGHAVVADFGIARAIDAAGGERLTETGIAVGTPQYMSPEQAGGEKELDGRSDLYALGCVLHEMLAGQPPFTGPTVESLVLQHLSAEPPSVTVIRPAVPGWVAAALERSLAKTPADRFNPVALFGEAIAPRTSVTATGAQRADADGTRRWLVPGLLGAAALIVIAVVLFRVLPSGPLTITASNIVQVTSEPGLEFQPALSPNGEEVTFVVGPIGNPRIAMQSTIDVGRGGGARPSEEVGGIHWFPSWTPGGASIRFMACPVGYRLPIEDCDWHEVGKLGGSPRAATVRRATGRHAWFKDGTRVAVAVQDSVFAYSADGGEPELLGVHVGEPPGPHSLAWSMDGRWIAFVSGNAFWRTSANKAGAAIWILDANGGEPVRVTDGESMNVSPQWLPDSRHLLFVSNRDGARGIYVVEVGPEGARGSPRSVPGASDPHSISISADGRRLAYAKFSAEQNIWSIPIPPSGSASLRDAVQITTGNQVIESHSLSPDGEWVAFDGDRLGDSDIYRVRLTGEPAQPQVIEDITGDAFYPDWSPDGTEISFNATVSEGSGVEVLVVPAGGGTARPLTDFPGFDYAADWSPDGLTLAIKSQGSLGVGPRKIWTLSRDSVGLPWDPPEPLTEFGCEWPDWAPDGASLVCVCRPDNEDTPICPDDELARVSRDGEVISRYDPAAAGFSAFGSPRFSRDGSKLYFIATHEDGSEGVWWIPANGGPATRVVAFDDPSLAVFNALTVGPENIYLSIARYESDIWVMDLEW